MIYKYYLYSKRIAIDFDDILKWDVFRVPEL